MVAMGMYPAGGGSFGSEGSRNVPTEVYSGGDDVKEMTVPTLCASAGNRAGAFPTNSGLALVKLIVEAYSRD